SVGAILSWIVVTLVVHTTDDVHRVTAHTRTRKLRRVSIENLLVVTGGLTAHAASLSNGRIPLPGTTLPGRQVGEGVSPALDAVAEQRTLSGSAAADRETHHALQRINSSHGAGVAEKSAPLPARCMVGGDDPSVRNDQTLAAHSLNAVEKLFDRVFGGLAVLVANQIAALNLSSENRDQVGIGQLDRSLRHPDRSMSCNNHVGHESSPIHHQCPNVLMYSASLNM